LCARVRAPSCCSTEMWYSYPVCTCELGVPPSAACVWSGAVGCGLWPGLKVDRGVCACARVCVVDVCGRCVCARVWMMRACVCGWCVRVLRCAVDGATSSKPVLRDYMTSFAIWG